MENIWNNPDEYERTTKRLQYQYLKKLLDGSDIGGRILDVGCGTGNVLSLLENVEFYQGVDISASMIEKAKERFPDYEDAFMVGDFLNSPMPGMPFDNIIIAACIHWFRPEEQKLLDKAREGLKKGGRIFVSGAHTFKLRRDDHVKDNILDGTRAKFRTVTDKLRFSRQRFDSDEIIRLMDNYKITRFETYEHAMEFDSYEDFRDWHLGSGTVVGMQFDENDREEALEFYYKSLYDAFLAESYQPLYSTFLLNAVKA